MSAKPFEEWLAALLSRRGHHLRIVRRFVGDPTDAEDVLQHAYVRALEHAHTLRNGERLVQWFERLLRNAAIDRVRRRQASARAVASLARQVRQTTANEIVGGNSCRCAHRLLQAIPSPYAEVLRRVYLEELSIEEVAGLLGTTKNNVRVRLHRARVVLRVQLIAYCGTCAEDGFGACECSGRPEGVEQAV